jgi:hypothetical protein
MDSDLKKNVLEIDLCVEKEEQVNAFTGVNEAIGTLSA